MHIAVIGIGRMGEFHARTLRGLPEVERLTLVGHDADRVSALARELQATALPSMEDAISAGIDAVVIATSTESHAALVEGGIEARVPVFCEKPIALDLETTDRIAEKVRAFSVSVQIGFHRRFAPGFQLAREQVRAGATWSDIPGANDRPRSRASARELHRGRGGCVSRLAYP